MSKFFKSLLAGLYFSMLIYVVFFARRRKLVTEPSVNWVPFRNTLKEYHNMDIHIYKDVYEFCTNLFGNIIMFVPFSMVLVSLFRFTSTKKILLLAFVTSVTIEVLQYVFVVGVSDMDDVVLNVLGAYIGLLIYRFFSPRPIAA